MSKNCFLGAPRVKFDYFRHDICFVRDNTIYHGLATFYASGPISFRTQNRLGHTMCTTSFFFTFFRYFWRPRDAQGGSKAGPRSLKGATRTPQGIPGTPKNRLKISLGYDLVTQGRPGGSRGTHRKEIHTKIDQKTLLSHHPQSVNKFAGVTPFQTPSTH